MRIVARVLMLAAAFAVITPAVTTIEGCSAAAKKKKGATQKGAAAKSDGQKAGGSSTGAKSKASSKGDNVDGLACDEAAEGVAWCNSDTAIVFCAGGDWYELDCGAAGLGVCAEGDDHVVDCFSADDAE